MFIFHCCLWRLDCSFIHVQLTELFPKNKLHSIVIDIANIMLLWIFYIIYSWYHLDLGLVQVGGPLQTTECTTSRVATCLWYTR